MAVVWRFYCCAMAILWLFYVLFYGYSIVLLNNGFFGVWQSFYLIFVWLLFLAIFLFDFCVAFMWLFCGYSMAILWRLYGYSIAVLLRFYGDSMAIRCCCIGDFLNNGFLGLCNVLFGFVVVFYRDSMVILWLFYGYSMGYSMVILWLFYGYSIGLPPKKKVFLFSFSILFYSILFYSILFYSVYLTIAILFYSILFYSILFYSILFY